MRVTQLLLPLTICLILFHVSLNGQEVWPGDVNNNGIVNSVDLLYYGIAYGSSGPERSSVNTDWAPQTVPNPWAGMFPNGINYAYADCDGDGLVDETDLEDAIEENFGLTHGVQLPDNFTNGEVGINPQIRLIPDATVVGEGAIISIDLQIDDSNMPIDNFYGMALKIGYTPELLAGDDGPDFDLIENSWFDPNNEDSESIYEDGDGSGQAELGITRTNQQSVTVSPDALGQFSIVIEDIIVGLEVDTFKIWIDSVLFIDPLLTATATATDTAIVIVAKDGKVTANQEIPHLQPVRLYPNPVMDGQLFLKTDEPLENIQLFDELGRAFSLSAQRQTTGTYRVMLPDLPPGFYVLGIQTKYQWHSEKFFITK
ncbi:MAG: T9SS type A sorting domain-containing protein [Saprospiraceae bacterium]|nr:T9SS type A sorting domain-containing protein [Saprospiraceae bacterium]